MRGGVKLYRDNMKRLDAGVENPCPSTSKGGIGKEKERLAPAASTSQSHRYAGQDSRPTFEEAKYPDDGELQS